jgi:hypothetical protein
MRTDLKVDLDKIGLCDPFRVFFPLTKASSKALLCQLLMRCEVNCFTWAPPPMEGLDRPASGY